MRTAKAWLLTSVTVAFFSSNLLATPIQWSIADGGNGHWYELVWDHQNWHAAREAATQRQFSGLSGYLATFTSSEEEAWVRQNLTLAFVIWTGGHIDEGGTVWSWWSTGEVFDYQNWEGGVAPQGTALGMCLAPSAWRAENDSNYALHYLVEYGFDPVAAPAQTWGSIKALFR